VSTLLHRIADKALNRPLLIMPAKAQVILAVLAGRIGINAAEASRFEGSPVERTSDGRSRVKPYNTTSSGVGIITVTGSLVNRGAWIGADSGLTSYEGIQHQVKAATADPGVRAVILDMASPGGEAIGAFETAALVRQLATTKRTVAIVNGIAASAAYAIASGATEIVTTPTGVSGSIGVVLLHADFSRKLAKDGIDPTLIFAGAHKVDGNPFEPLSKEVRAELQAEVDTVYKLFLDTVAIGRGARLTSSAARATEGRSFVGEAAVKAGLADRVGTFEDVLAELSQPGGVHAAKARAATALHVNCTETAASGAPAASNVDQLITRALAAAKAAPRVDPVRAARQAEYDASAALRALWPTFDAYSSFVAAAEMAALARHKGR